MKLRIFMAVLIASLSVASARAIEPNKPAERVQDAARVVNEIMAAPDKGIPQDLLSNAHCVAVIPSMKMGGFIFGARYGKGVMTCRGEGGVGWTGPSTVRIEGGSFGFQIGGSAVDLVLLVMNERGAEKLMRSEFTLGGDATVAAGPVGRSVQAQTDALMNAQILAYARSRGLFAGAVVEGATLRSDDSDNRTLYGRAVDHETILQGRAGTPPSARVLINTLNEYSPRET